ncbi:MAG: class I SAM-dependent methyltransferase [Chitinophagales bacterium]|nr:class I SAM-dependent methyltransferase [Chitinophagales bacterium]
MTENLAYWDELALIHSSTGQYGMSTFLRGESTLQSIEDDFFRQTKGAKVLHLQCHFGLDTLSIAKEHNREVVGIDFSPNAIEVASKLSKDSGIPARFICCNLYDLEQHLNEQFDIVYTSYGVLMWLHDLVPWAKFIAKFLKNGGRFFLVEEHPFAAMMGINKKGEITPCYPYNGPYITHNFYSYANKEVMLQNKVQHKYAHSLEVLFMVLMRQNLNIISFREYDFCFYQIFPGMRKNDEGWYILEKDKYGGLPLQFSLHATKN